MHSFLSLFLCLHLLVASALFPSVHALSSPILFTETQIATEENAAAPSEQQAAAENAPGISVAAPSALLMEASTGTIIFEKDSHSVRHPASITKIMTLILIFDALKKGSIQLTDTVTVSEHAASMGGSQVFLEAGETQDVETMIKCISIASANDACVAFHYSRQISVQITSLLFYHYFHICESLNL